MDFHFYVAAMNAFKKKGKKPAKDTEPTKEPAKPKKSRDK